MTILIVKIYCKQKSEIMEINVKNKVKVNITCEWNIL